MLFTFLTLVVAVGRDKVIGKNNAMPWRSAADMRKFRALTLGGAVLMGRRTHESIGRALPERRNIVLSRKRGYSSPGCEIVASVDAAITAAGDLPIFVIGGEQIYRQTLSRADCLHITEVDCLTPDGDAFFPDFDASGWEMIHREECAEENPPLVFVTYKKPAAR